ncbi:MAG: winged helix-turn-helix domain-containing protein, partial [Alphaproteobacteria bacterium]|nr:winged helix-turn-helix domain-containing protein [Alphaproteobacteria bacterium]
MNRVYGTAEWRGAVELSHQTPFEIGQMKIAPSLCEIACDGVRTRVEPRVMQALVVFARAKGAVISRDQLVQRCWGGRIVSEDAINRCIAKVRKVSEIDGGASFRLERVPRVGYRLIEQAVTTPTVPDAHIPDARPLTASPSWRPRYMARRWWWFAGGALLLVLAVGIVWERWNGPAQLTFPAGKRIVAHAPAPPAGTVFRDCKDGCPEMVVIPPGRFLMGSSSSDLDRQADEMPTHLLSIGKPFALGRYPVTRQEFGRFAAETGMPEGGSEVCSIVNPA